MKKGKKRGYTLIELVIAIVVVAIGFYSIMALFINVVPKNINVETLSRSSHLANKVAEETLAKGFSNISSVSPTAFSSPFSGYTYMVSVNYASTLEPNNTSMTPTNYKKVEVKCWGGTASTVEIITLVGSYE